MNSTFYLSVSDYSTVSLVIACVSATISFFLGKFLFQKLPVAIKNAFPFLLGFLLYIIYGLIFSEGKFAFTDETTSTGIVCGSLSIGFFAFINNLKQGKISCDALSSSVFSLIDGLVENTKITTDKIIAVANKTDGTKEKKDALSVKIREILKEDALDKTDIYIDGLSKIVYECIVTVRNL